MRLIIKNKIKFIVIFAIMVLSTTILIMLGAFTGLRGFEYTSSLIKSTGANADSVIAEKVVSEKQSILVEELKLVTKQIQPVTLSEPVTKDAYGYLYSLYEYNGQKYINMTFAELLTGNDARDAWVKAYPDCINSEAYDCREGGGLTDRSIDKKLYTYLVNDQTEFVYRRYSASEKYSYETKTFDQVRYSARWWRVMQFYIVDGVVVRVEEEW